MLIPLESVLSLAEVSLIRQNVATANWQDGKETAGSLASSVKQNLQLDDLDPLTIDFRNTILRRLGNHSEFISAALPLRIYPPKFNCYQHGGHYGLHVDSAVMNIPNSQLSVRTDISCTLFLCNADEYDGGELEIETAFGAQEVKMNAGDMILYPASSLHRVTPVTRGARIASFFWVQSMVHSEEKRTLLHELDQSIQALRLDLPHDHPSIIQLTGVYHNLLRQSAST